MGPCNNIRANLVWLIAKVGLGNTSGTIMGGFKLEMLKFGLYLIVPACTVAYFERPEVFQQILRRRKYIVFPGTGEDRDDLDALMKKQKQEMKNFKDKI